MSKIRIIAFSYFLFVSFYGISQTIYGLDSIQTISRLKKDLLMLASDEYLGREAGTIGEKMAREYIVGQFKQIGLMSLNKDSLYLNPFQFKDGYKLGRNNIFQAEKLNFTVEKDYYVAPFSGNADVKGEFVYVNYGIVDKKSNFNDYAGFTLENLKNKIFVIDANIPPEKEADTSFAKYKNLKEKAKIAVENGAIAIIFVNVTAEMYERTKKKDFAPEKIPVVIAKSRASKYILNQKSLQIRIKTEIEKKTKTGYNVVGVLDNRAKTTVVIGGHYDHLGVRESKDSNKKSTKVYNGADDNGSGTVTVIELARRMKSSKFKNHNYIFVAFSAEEKGLIGSAQLLKSGILDTFKLLCMLNFDMIGRLDSSKRTITIMGTGTSPIWDTLLENTYHPSFKLRKSSSGMGSSDHSSFYLKQIPALFFFTGIHKDYHKPSDDVDKINFGGMYSIIRYVDKSIEKIDKIQSMPFKSTKDTANRMNFSVTLGVVPDHSYDSIGLKISGVVPGKLAEKYAFKADDIILKIGDYPTDNIHLYMAALGKFKKGDKAVIKFLRGREEIMKEVIFQ